MAPPVPSRVVFGGGVKVRRTCSDAPGWAPRPPAHGATSSWGHQVAPSPTSCVFMHGAERDADGNRQPPLTLHTLPLLSLCPLCCPTLGHTASLSRRVLMTREGRGFHS